MARNRVGVPFDNPTRYVGPGTDLIPIIKVSRQPTTSDDRYPLGQFWLIGDSPTTGTVGDIWYLKDYVAGVPQWAQFSSGASGTPIETVTGDDAVAVSPDGAGDLGMEGLTVANATNAKPVYLNGDAGNNKQVVEVQVAAARTGAPGDKNDAGLCSFDDTAFAVDADGYVTLAGGPGAAVDSVNVDANTGPGTDPVLPDSNGLLNVAGAAVAAHSVPVETHSRAANTYNIEVQVAAAVTGAPSNKNAAGLAQFDDTGFTVDADGYVQLIGGGGAPTLGVVGDEGSGNVPDGSGNITITGDTVANATHAKPVYVDDTAANASTIDVQVAAAVTGAPADKLDAGLSSYDDTEFAVDANGYVTLVNPVPSPANIDWFDDLNYTNIGVSSGSDPGSKWATSTTAPLIGAVQQHFGTFRVAAGGGGVAYNGLTSTTGGAAITLDFYLNAGSATVGAAQRLVIGLTDSTAAPQFTHNNVIWFEANLSATNWFIRAKNSGTSTTQDTSTAVDANWHKFTLVINAAGSSVEGFIDDVSVGTVASNLPATSTGLRIYYGNTSSTADTYLDWVRYRQTRGT